MLSAIVQKVTGEKIIDYLAPRLFEPLGIEGMDWEEDPQGINTGGWGLRITTRDMAKFGQLLLQKGQWNGKEILPASWIEEATTFKIDQNPDARQSQRDSSDWLQGYCYQFWRCRNNGFRADGAYGQFIIVLPDQDAVIAINSESPDMQDEINLVWKYLFPAMQENALPENSEAAEKLKQKLGSLSLRIPAAGSGALQNSANSIKYELTANERKYESVGFEFKDSVCTVSLQINGNTYKHHFGGNNWIEEETGRPGPSLTGPVKISDSYKVAGAYSWKNDNTLELILRYIESPHHELITCKFDKENVSISFAPSLAFGNAVFDVKGKISRQ